MGLRIGSRLELSATSRARSQTGIDWDGTGDERRMLYWATPPAIYDMTYIWKVYIRDQVTGVGDNSRYFTSFFWGNNGRFDWDSGNAGTYYGCHPYPTPANTNDGKWEISIRSNDVITRDDDSAPATTWNTWYSQAFRASRASASVTDHKFYIDLPSVETVDTITHQINDSTWADTDPPSPAIVWGQTGDYLGNSWGGYSRWEETNGIYRGIQIYNTTLSEAHCIALGAFETDAEVLAYCSTNGITSLWYLNMNPTPTDVTDKSGNGNNPAWEGTARPTLWTAA